MGYAMSLISAGHAWGPAIMPSHTLSTHFPTVSVCSTLTLSPASSALREDLEILSAQGFVSVRTLPSSLRRGGGRSWGCTGSCSWNDPREKMRLVTADLGTCQSPLLHEPIPYNMYRGHVLIPGPVTVAGVIACADWLAELGECPSSAQQ